MIIEFDELQVAHLLAIAQMRDVWGHRHRLLPASDDDVGVAIGDLLQADGDCAQARAAELVEAERCLLERNAGLHRRLTRRVLALAALEDLAEDDFVDIAAVDLGRRQRGLDRAAPSS